MKREREKIKKWASKNKYLIIGAGLGLLTLKANKRINKKQTNNNDITNGLMLKDYFKVSDTGRLGENMVKQGCNPNEHILGVITDHSYVHYWVDTNGLKDICD